MNPPPEDWEITEEIPEEKVVDYVNGKLIIDTLEPRVSFSEKDEISSLIHRSYRVPNDIIDPDTAIATKEIADMVKESMMAKSLDSEKKTTTFGKFDYREIAK